MKVLTANTQGLWKSPVPPAIPLPGQQVAVDSAVLEARRVLSDLFRCNNLIVLSGLGTSLCVSAHPGGAPPPTMKNLWDRVKIVADQAAKQANPNFMQLLTLVGHPANLEDIEALLTRCRLAESFLAPSPQRTAVSSFIPLAEQEIVKATNFVWQGHSLPHHVEFLRRTARRSNRKSRTKIFTTNYDRCFEEAGRQGRYVVVDGFSQTVPPTFDAVHFTYDTVRRSTESDTQDFIPNVFHLYKLHGSIDWVRDEGTGEILKGVPGKPLIIYPRNSKYELAFEQPYLELIGALQTALREPNTGLLVVGFGFNDSHLAEPIMASVRSNLGLKIVAVGPYLAPWKKDGEEVEQPGEYANNKYLAKFQKLAAAGDARVALLNCGFEDLNSYVPDLAAESDLEQHFARLRTVDQM